MKIDNFFNIIKVLPCRHYKHDKTYHELLLCNQINFFNLKKSSIIIDKNKKILNRLYSL